MTTGFGIDPTLTEEGVVTSGTSSKDIRNITAGLYSPGVISGALVTTSASSMQYTVSAGVAAFPIAVGETVLGAVPATVVSTSAAPVSGQRIDIIYAQQGLPTVDGHSNINVRVGTSLPARSVELGRRIILPSSTNTNASQKTGDVTYAIPYGASMGIIHQYRDTRNGIINHARTVVNTANIFLPTDRMVRISLLSAMSSLNANRWDASKYCSTGYDVWVDTMYRSHFQTTGLDKVWSTFQFSDIYTLLAGQHTIRFEMVRGDGPGSPVAHHGSGWPGSLWTLEDIGPAK